MTDRLDEKIRAFVAELVNDPPATPEIDFEGVESPGVAALRRSPSRRRWVPAVVAAGAAFAVLIAVGLPVLFLGSGDGVVADQTTTTVGSTTSVAPSTTVAPTIVPSMVEAWQEVSTDVISPAFALVSASRFGPGFVTVGLDFNEETGRQNSAVFVSEDGVKWSRMAEGTPELTQGAVFMYGVNEGGPGVIAVGMGCESNDPCRPYPTVWTSADGAEWSRFGADAGDLAENEFGTMFDVLATEHGIVAVGEVGSITEDDTSSYQPVVWLSPNGTDWTRVFEGEPVDPGELVGDGPSIQSVAEGPDGLVVGVGHTMNENSERVAAVWMSTDGQSWERVDPTQPGFDGPSVMYDVAWGSGGFIATGSAGGVEAAIWTSPDGYAWSRLDLSVEPFDSIATLASVAALESGYVAGGPHAFEDMRGGWMTLWTSVDGKVWDRVQTTGPGHVMAIVAAEAGIVVAGGKWEEDANAAVWVGPVLDPASPAPDPQPPIPDEYEENTDGDETDSIRDLDDGFSCDELAADTWGYKEAISYWANQGVPEGFDLDADGPPCASAYPQEDVVDVFGGHDALSVVIKSSYDDSTFTATGSAVDAGVACAEGTIDLLGGSRLHDEVAFARWEDEFTCSDGSGTFVGGVDDYIFEDDRSRGPWNIVSGTGAYAAMSGGGIFATIPNERYQLRLGRLWYETGED